MALQTGVKAIDKFTRQADKMYCDPYAKVIFAGKVRSFLILLSSPLSFSPLPLFL